VLIQTLWRWRRRRRCHVEMKCSLSIPPCLGAGAARALAAHGVEDLGVHPPNPRAWQLLPATSSNALRTLVS